MRENPSERGSMSLEKLLALSALAAGLAALPVLGDYESGFESESEGETELSDAGIAAIQEEAEAAAALVTDGGSE